MITRSLDDLDRLAFRLSRTVRTQYPHLLQSGFTLTDLEERLLPFREARREMSDSGQHAFDVAVLRLLSGERDYLRVSSPMQQACHLALGFPAPALSLIGEWTSAPIMLGAGPDTGDAVGVAEDLSCDVFPSPTVSLDPTNTNRQRPSPTAGCAEHRACCQYCDGVLPAGRTATYCPHCGMDLTKHQCEGCSAEMDVAWRFCISCGRGNRTEIKLTPAHHKHG